MKNNSRCASSYFYPDNVQDPAIRIELMLIFDTQDLSDIAIPNYNQQENLHIIIPIVVVIIMFCFCMIALLAYNMWMYGYK